MKRQTLRPSPTALLNPRCDAIFKAIFTDNSDEGRLALKSFLEAVLEAEVSDVRLVPGETAIESEGDKQAVFDIACTLNGNEAANIEMQGIDIHASYDKRAEYNAAHLLNHCVPKGTNFREIPKVFQISVLNFVYDSSTTQAFSLYKMQTDDDRRLSGRMSIIFIELPKVAKNISDDIENLTAAEKWGKFLIYADDEGKRDYIKKLCSEEEGIMAAEGILSKISQDDINWVRQNSHEKWLMDYNTGMLEATERGIAQGVEQGIKQGRAEAQEQIEAAQARIAELEARLAKYESV